MCKKNIESNCNNLHEPSKWNDEDEDRLSRKTSLNALFSIKIESYRKSVFFLCNIRHMGSNIFLGGFLMYWDTFSSLICPLLLFAALSIPCVKILYIITYICHWMLDVTLTVAPLCDVFQMLLLWSAQWTLCLLQLFSFPLFPRPKFKKFIKILWTLLNRRRISNGKNEWPWLVFILFSSFSVIQKLFF